MISILLQLKADLAEDAADALAVALCHHHTQQTAQRMHALGGGGLSNDA
jgi:Holliday junction resolvasome RuvABC endonuclease subunit